MDDLPLCQGVSTQPLIVPQTNNLRVALPVVDENIWDMLNETDLLTWDRENERPHWTQTAVDFASVLKILKQPQQIITDDELVRIAVESGLQSIEEHWGTVYRAASLAQLRAFADALWSKRDG